MPTTLPRPNRTRSCGRLASGCVRTLLLAGALGCAVLAQAQVFGDNEWKEDPAPPPPAFSQDHLIPIDMPRYMSLAFGVDPATIRIGADGVVSYVVIARNREDGGFNAMFEGIHCASEEYKTYARFTNGAWQIEKAPEWKRINDRNSLYTKRISAQGMCRDHATQPTAQETARKMVQPLRDLN